MATFTPQLLNDVNALKGQCFDLSSEIKTLSQPDPQKKQDSYFFGPWQVVWVITTSPFRVITYTALKSLAFFLYFARVKQFSIQLDLKANHQLRVIEAVFTQFKYGKRLICPLFNDYYYGLSHLYTLPNIPREKLGDRFVQNNLHKTKKQIQFNLVGKGLCHGATLITNALFLRAKWERVPLSTEELLYKISYPRREGFGEKAALIQTIYGLGKDLLDLIDLHHYQQQFSNKKEEKKKVGEWIDALPNGVYNLEIHYTYESCYRKEKKTDEPNGHGVSLIKHEEGQYIVDSNQGVIDVSGQDQVLDSIEQYLSSNKGRCLLYCEQQALRGNWLDRLNARLTAWTGKR